VMAGPDADVEKNLSFRMDEFIAAYPAEEE